MADFTYIQYFLGANSPSGFYSLYDHLLSPETAREIFILKGGPGCGKSTLMRTVGTRVSAAGFPCEAILCSGDPASLDGVVFPTLNIALVDGTAPHVVEPKYPGVVERYVNLGDCYDRYALGNLRREIMDCMKGYKSCYQSAYRCLGAAAQLLADMRAILVTDELRQRMARRADGILSRECKPRKGAAPGTVHQRFLDAVTHTGTMCLYGTAASQCSRIYLLHSRCGLSHELLSPLLTGAVRRGYSAVACPDPMVPQRLNHLLIPELSLAFLTDAPEQPFPGTPYRRLHLDSMAQRELLRRSRPRLRFSRKVSSALVEEAVESLSQAKAMHDDLEGLYNPHVDFSRVEQTALEIVETILK